MTVRVVVVRVLTGEGRPMIQPSDARRACSVASDSRASCSPPDGARSTYAVLWNALNRLAANYSASENAMLFSGTAKRAYRLA